MGPVGGGGGMHSPCALDCPVFAKTRKGLVEMLLDHGINIPYDRLLEISAQLGYATVEKYVEEGVVCPPVLRKNLFTTAVLDNRTLFQQKLQFEFQQQMSLNHNSHLNISGSIRLLQQRKQMMQ